VPKLVLPLARLSEAVEPDEPWVGAAAATQAPDADLRPGDGAVRLVGPPTPLGRWSEASATSADAALVVDTGGAVVTVSAAAAELLGCGNGVVGRPLADVLALVDFESGDADPEYSGRIAPLAAVTAGSSLARSLLRVRHPDGQLVTIDTIAAPLHDGVGRLVGAVCFLARVTAR